MPLLVACALLACCQAPPQQPGTPPATAPAGTSAPPSPAPSPSRGEPRDLVLGHATLALPEAATLTRLPDATVQVTLPVPAGAAPLITVEGGGFEVIAGRVRLDDGSLLTRPVAESGEGSASAAAFVADGDAITVPQAHEALTLTFLAGTRLVEESRWESGSRILISPTSLARDLSPGDILAASELAPDVMAEVVEQHPGRAGDLDTSTALNQLACHMIGARDKETWNLELDRVDKGLAGFIGSRCN